MLLDGNPIEAVQNLHKVYAVKVHDGTFYSKGDLEALKLKVLMHVESAQAALPNEKAEALAEVSTGPLVQVLGLASLYGA